MPDMEEGAAPEKKSDFLRRLFRGDVGLARTFWVYGIVMGFVLLPIASACIDTIVVAIGNAVAGPGAAAGSVKPLYQSSSYLLWAVVIVYRAFIYIAIWRSARKYAGLKLWKVLAQVYVILSWLIIPYELYHIPAEVEEYYEMTISGTYGELDGW